MKKVLHFSFCIFVFTLISCQNTNHHDSSVYYEETNANDKKYWYNGTAELTTYDLLQSRYGEQHNGKATLIFVTEPFSPTEFVKSDDATKEDISVLKLNLTKKFNTGIYPYSLMTSIFTPFEDTDHPLKVSFSGQEWCGHAYMEMVHKLNPQVKVSSYFQSESFENKEVKAAFYEDEIWNLIRRNSKKLKAGTYKIVPSFEFLRLYHKPVQAYEAVISFIENGDQNKHLVIEFPELKRIVQIDYSSEFPYKIIGWKDQITAESGKIFQTIASSPKSINLDYWAKHNVQNSIYRIQLGLQ